MMKMMKSRGSHRFLLSYKSWSERRGSVHKTFHVSCVIQKKLTFYLLFSTRLSSIMDLLLLTNLDIVIFNVFNGAFFTKIGSR